MQSIRALLGGDASSDGSRARGGPESRVRPVCITRKRRGATNARSILQGQILRRDASESPLAEPVLRRQVVATVEGLP
eukprot:8650753-Prorocentrum_lima.AAC.1